MNIRSLYELSERLEENLAWRKKELSALFLLIQGARDHQRFALRRAAVAILYAHWEGFVKTSADFYLELVARQGHRYRELKTNFVTLACRNALIDAGISKKTYIQAQVVDFLILNQDEKCNFPFKGILSTSNLNAEVLRDIFFTTGLTYEAFWASKEPLLDGSLLRLRNDIAHGRRVIVDQQTYDQLHNLVVDLITFFKDTIENAAAQKAYLRATQAKAA